MSFIAQTPLLLRATIWLLKKWRPDMAPIITTTWQSLAEQASIEMDGKKLAVLVERLCAALDASRAPRIPQLEALPALA